MQDSSQPFVSNPNLRIVIIMSILLCFSSHIILSSTLWFKRCTKHCTIRMLEFYCDRRPAINNVYYSQVFQMNPINSILRTTATHCSEHNNIIFQHHHHHRNPIAEPLNSAWPRIWQKTIFAMPIIFMTINGPPITAAVAAAIKQWQQPYYIAWLLCKLISSKSHLNHNYSSRQRLGFTILLIAFIILILIVECVCVVISRCQCISDISCDFPPWICMRFSFGAAFKHSAESDQSSASMSSWLCVPSDNDHHRQWSWRRRRWPMNATGFIRIHTPPLPWRCELQCSQPVSQTLFLPLQHIS